MTAVLLDARRRAGLALAELAQFVWVFTLVVVSWVALNRSDLGVAAWLFGTVSAVLWRIDRQSRRVLALAAEVRSLGRSREAVPV